MSQDTLAKRAGITQSCLSEIEIGRKKRRRSNAAQARRRVESIA
jgi:DNA-binding XRE family transcriptional regulator